VQVAHFEPETIHLCGEAIFPRIFLNLPRDSVTDEYSQLLCTARENLLKEANTKDVSALDAASGADFNSPVVLVVMLVPVITVNFC